VKIYNGNYEYEFKDSEYENEIKAFLDSVKSAAVKFYNTRIPIGTINISPQQICYEPNELLINKAVQDALSDIKRIKDYHTEVKNPEIAKFASYIGYWLSRAKPFSLKHNKYEALFLGMNDNEQKKVKLNFCYAVNEIFIAELMLAMIFGGDLKNDVVSASDVCLNIRKSNNMRITPLNTILDLLVYYLIYRSRGPQELELFLIGLSACPTQMIKDFRAS